MLADVEPEDATDKTVSWSITRGEEYATINKTGLLTASNNGVVTVRATANDGSGVFGEADISILIVKPKATAVTILHGGQDVTGQTLGIDLASEDKTIALTAEVNPTDAGQGILWTTSNSKVATVDENGVVTGLSKGTATITATATDGSGKIATVKIKVDSDIPIIIPDSALEAAIRDHLDYPVGEITRPIMEQLTGLSCHGEGIVSLVGLELAVNLRTLDIPANQFTDLSPLANLPNLELLKVHFNNLTEINVLLQIPNLQEVHLNHNLLDLTSGSDARNVIEELKVRGVKVYHDAFPPTPDEEAITIPDSILESVLREDLNYPAGQITESVLGCLAFLHSGDYRGISDLTGLEYATNIEEIYMPGNQVEDITVLLSLPNLRWVNIEDNPLDSSARTVIEELISRGVTVVHDPYS
jgi:hypothetical protein